MTSPVTPICYSCDRLLNGARRSCTAFPDGIPELIWTSQRDHRQPFRGDQALQFLQDPDKPKPPFGIGMYDFEIPVADRG